MPIVLQLKMDWENIFPQFCYNFLENDIWGHYLKWHGQKFCGPFSSDFRTAWQSVPHLNHSVPGSSGMDPLSILSQCFAHIKLRNSTWFKNVVLEDSETTHGLKVSLPLISIDKWRCVNPVNQVSEQPKLNRLLKIYSLFRHCDPGG